MGLTVVTVLHEGADVLVRTLPTWARSCREMRCDVLFVDNSTTSGPREVVESQDWGDCIVDYLEEPSNPGFAASANRGIAAARNDRVFLLNADVYLEPDALLRAGAASTEAGPIAVSLVTKGVKTTGVSIDRIGYFSDRSSAARRSCLGPSGGAAIYSRRAFIAGGGFPEDLFAWGEDAALALRQWARGVQSQELDLALVHVGGHTVASRAGLRFKARLLSRNRIRVMRRQYSGPLMLTIGVLQLGVVLLNGLRKIPAGTAGPHFHGIVDGLRGSVVRDDVGNRFGVSAYRSYMRAACVTSAQEQPIPPSMAV